MFSYNPRRYNPGFPSCLTPPNVNAAPMSEISVRNKAIVNKLCVLPIDIFLGRLGFLMFQNEGLVGGGLGGGFHCYVCVVHNHVSVWC